MLCAAEDHLFGPGTAQEVRRAAQQPFTVQTRRLWGCALCHHGVDLVGLLLDREREQRGRERGDEAG